MRKRSGSSLGILALVLAGVVAFPLQGATIDQALDTLAELNDQTSKCASIVNFIYEGSLVRIHDRARRLQEIGSAFGASTLEQQARHLAAQSALIEELYLKQLTTLIGSMRQSHGTFVTQTKESQKSIGVRRTNRLLRRAADIFFLIEIFEQQVKSASIKLESLDSLLDSIVGAGGQGSWAEVVSLVRLSYRDRLDLRETLRGLTRLIVQEAQDLREALRLARRLGRAEERAALSAAGRASQTELHLYDLEGRLRFRVLLFDGASAATALAEPAHALARGVYLYSAAVYDSQGRLLYRTVGRWVLAARPSPSIPLPLNGRGKRGAQGEGIEEADRWESRGR